MSRDTKLVERYLQAVRSWLPKEQADDILAELGEDLRSQIEERQAALGRALGEDDLAEILVRRGRPLVVAGGYLPREHLIGPVLFPVFRRTLKIVLACYLVPWLAVPMGLILFSSRYRGAQSAFDRMGELWGGVVLTTGFLFAAVTIGFALWERGQMRSGSLESWDPRKLPALRVPREHRPISRASTFVELVLGSMILSWWVDGARGLSVRGLPAGAPTWSWGPVWQDFHERFFLPILALGVAAMTLATVNFFRPYWTRTRIGMRAAIHALLAACVVWVLAAQRVEIQAEWLKATGAHPSASQAELEAAWKDLIVCAVMLATAIVWAAIALYETVRLALWSAPRAGIGEAATAIVAAVAIGLLPAGSGGRIVRSAGDSARADHELERVGQVDRARALRIARPVLAVDGDAGGEPRIRA